MELAPADVRASKLLGAELAALAALADALLLPPIAQPHRLPPQPQPVIAGVTAAAGVSAGESVLPVRIPLVAVVDAQGRRFLVMARPARFTSVRGAAPPVSVAATVASAAVGVGSATSASPTAGLDWLLDQTAARLNVRAGNGSLLPAYR